MGVFRGYITMKKLKQPSPEGEIGLNQTFTLFALYSSFNYFMILVNLKNLSASTKKRQEKLLQDHYFLCECPRCLDTKSDNLKNSMKCTNCNNGCVLKLVKKMSSKESKDQ